MDYVANLISMNGRLVWEILSPYRIKVFNPKAYECMTSICNEIANIPMSPENSNYVPTQLKAKITSIGYIPFMYLDKVKLHASPSGTFALDGVCLVINKYELEFMSLEITHAA